MNGDIQLLCVTNGNPPPAISWLLNGALISTATESVYMISPVIAESAGEYSCMASNSVSTVTATLTLTVLCKLLISPVVIVRRKCSKKKHGLLLCVSLDGHNLGLDGPI